MYILCVYVPMNGLVPDIWRYINVSNNNNTTNHSLWLYIFRAGIANVYFPNELPPQPTPTVATQHKGVICLHCLISFKEKVISEAINIDQLVSSCCMNNSSGIDQLTYRALFQRAQSAEDTAHYRAMFPMTCCELVKVNLTIISIQRITHAFDCTFGCAFDKPNVCGSHSNARYTFKSKCINKFMEACE